MLETAVDNGTQELGLQQKVAETGRVHTNIGSLLVLGLLGSIGLGGSGSGVDGLDNIIILFVVNKIVVVVGHGLNRSWRELEDRIKKTVDKLDPGRESARTQQEPGQGWWKGGWGRFRLVLVLEELEQEAGGIHVLETKDSKL